MFKESDNLSGKPEDFGVVRTFALKLSFQSDSTNRTLILEHGPMKSVAGHSLDKRNRRRKDDLQEWDIITPRMKRRMSERLVFL